MRLVFILLALVPLPAPVAAQDASYQPSETYAECMRQGDAARGNATAIDMCLGLEQTVQLQRLSDSFDRAFDSVTGWDQVRLYNEQTEWREGLDARCAEVARQDARNQSDTRAFNICRTLEIAARAAWLDDYSPE